MINLLSFLDPRVPRGVRWPHYAGTAVLVLVAALLVFLSGVLVGRHLAGPQDLKQSLGYVPQLNAPAPRVRVPAFPIKDTAPNSAHIYWRYLEGPGDQGSVGQCQCYASRKQADYLMHWRYQQTNPATWWITSCLFWYAEADQGQDSGSWPSQYPQIWAQQGAIYSPLYNYDYQGTPYQPGPYPPPAQVQQVAATHRYQSYYSVLASNQNGGLGIGAVQRAELAIARHNTVNIDIPVYGGAGSIFAAPYEVDNPQSGAPLDGGHGITLVSYYRSLTINGVTGWFVAQNNWGDDYGLTRNLGPDGQPYAAPLGTRQNGYFLISYRFVEQYAWELDVLHLQKTVSPTLDRPPVWRQPGPAKDKPVLAPRPVSVSRTPKTSIGNWVSRVYPRDISGDWGNTINQAAHANNISAPGLLSTLFSECGLFTHSTTCDRYGFWPDVSFGWCQVTVSTAGGLGIGTGTPASTEYVRQYDNVASQCVWLAARYLGQIKRYEASVGCQIDFPQLYVAWNAGPGNPCSWLYSPTGQAGTNFYGNYMANWNTALLYSSPTNPYAPRPKPFPVKKWGKLAYKDHGHLSWAAAIWLTHQSLGRYRGERWFARARFDKYTFRHGVIYAWPATHRYKVVKT